MPNNWSESQKRSFGTIHHDLGYYTMKDLEKLLGIFGNGREGIRVVADINVPDENNLLVEVWGDERYTDKVKLLDMFANILLVEML